jgi:hypothetical protein
LQVDRKPRERSLPFNPKRVKFFRPGVAGFCTHDPKAFLASPPYSRDAPLARFLE